MTLLPRFRTLALGVLVLALGLGDLAAQTGTFYNQRDDKYRVLGLKRAKEAYEVAKKDFDRQQELFSRGLIAQSELDRAKGNFADAEVNFQQSLLAVLFEQQYVSITRAVKYQTADGTRRVRLRLENASGGTEEFRKLLNLDDKLFRSLQPDLISNVYISLLNNESAIISQPYEAKLDQLKYGHPRDLEFTILQDLDAVTVNMIYGNGTQRSMKIFLQKDVSVNRVMVQAEQFSLEGELGSSAVFDLRLELFSKEQNTFTLATVNLPAQLLAVFKDPVNRSRLSQFRFTEATNTRKVALDVSLPDRPTDDVLMDKPIVFYVLVLPQSQAGLIASAGGKTWTQREIEQLQVGYARLELVPRGKGRLLVRLAQLYHTIGASDQIAFPVELVNEGTRRLDNVEIKLDLPPLWTREITPAIIPRLEVSSEERSQIVVHPPAGISAGRYEIRLRTSGLSDNQPVNAEDKTVTIEVQGGSNMLMTIVLIVVILGLVTGIVVFGIRLSRR
ncbi:MAG: hypothetical protein IPI01_13330 [Ignavibacteriae bacterium]|nr:hypothetical protein [Ignavibacteriota bacterium]